MIFELRIYTCRPGSVSAVLEIWQQQGQAMIEPYMKMVGQWTSESGTANQIYTLWAFKDLNHRQKARQELLAHPGFADYLAECRQYYLKQENVFLSPTTLSTLMVNLDD
jgi:hypothetical protein